MKNWIFNSLIYEFLKYIVKVYHFSICHKILSSSKNFIVVILEGSFLGKITDENSKFLYIIGASYIIREVNFLSKKCKTKIQTILSHCFLASLSATEKNYNFNLFKAIGLSLLILGVVNIALLSSEIGGLNLPLIFFNLVLIMSASLIITNRINWEQALCDSIVIKFIDNCCKI